MVPFIFFSFFSKHHKANSTMFGSIVYCAFQLIHPRMQVLCVTKLEDKFDAEYCWVIISVENSWETSLSDHAFKLVVSHWAFYFQTHWRLGWPAAKVGCQDLQHKKAVPNPLNSTQSSSATLAYMFLAWPFSSAHQLHSHCHCLFIYIQPHRCLYRKPFSCCTNEWQFSPDWAHMQPQLQADPMVGGKSVTPP